jgi:hypothetical protein
MLTVLSILVALLVLDLVSAYVPTEVGRELYFALLAGAQILWKAVVSWRFWVKAIPSAFVLSVALGFFEDATQPVVWGQWAQRFLDSNTRVPAVVHMFCACVVGAIMYRLMVGTVRRREQLAVKAVSRLYRPVVTPSAGVPDKIA